MLCLNDSFRTDTKGFTRSSKLIQKPKHSQEFSTKEGGFCALKHLGYWTSTGQLEEGSTHQRCAHRSLVGEKDTCGMHGHMVRCCKDTPKCMRNTAKGNLGEVILMTVNYSLDLVKSQQNISPKRICMEGHVCQTCKIYCFQHTNSYK